MAYQTHKTLTVADLYALPDDACRYELSHGRLVAEPAPGFRHGRIVAAIVRELQAYVQQHCNGIVLTAGAGFLLARGPDTVRAPDVAFICRERCETLLEEPGLFPGPPDLAVEELSPSDTRRRVAAKIADYLDAGTPEIWLVDPEHRKIRVCTGAGTRILQVGDTLESPAQMPGQAIVVARIFEPPWQ